jgi:hypothetical protein
VAKETLAPIATADRFSALVEPASWRGFSSRGLHVRLFLTCWLVYMLHFSPYVYRELYLTLSLAAKHSVHVDEYVDLHPDLFVMPGRGSFMGGNPGTSILAAVPYWISLPVVNRLAPVRPPKPGEKVSAEYRENRTDRVAFYQKVRERGLDVHLGMAAIITSCLFMAPLAALSTVVMFGLLRRLSPSPGPALGMALLYAFGTPVFFRTATLNLNLLVGLLGLFSFALLWWPSRARPEREPLRYFAAGFLAGWAVLTDYTGVITVSTLGLFALALQLEEKSFWPALKRSLWFVAGAIGPILFLLFWQWYCYGNPWLPVQFHQPKKYYMGYRTDRGFGWPSPAALWGLMFDPLYGLLVFSPIFALALYHFALLRRRTNVVPGRVAAFAWTSFLALWVFCSCIEYTLRFQWMDGVRYMVPAVPFLFLLVADALMQIPRALSYMVVLAAVAETWCLAMVRENPMESIMRVFLHGFELPWLTALVKTAPQYFPFLREGASPVALFLLWGVVIWGIWRIRDPWRSNFFRGTDIAA